MKELEDIIGEVGGKGLFQRRLLYLILVPLYFFQPMAWMNEIFFLHSPPHWCYHTMVTNFSEIELKSWKECHIPRNEKDGSFENCKMLLVNNSSPLSAHEHSSCPTKMLNQDPKNNLIIEKPCEWSWSYDTTEFSRTLVTDLNWFCNDSYNIPALYTYSKVGSMIGGMIFNAMGDLFGRKPIFWFVTGLVVVTMTAKTFIAEYYYAYVALKFIASTTFVPTYQLPFSIVCEVSDSDYRTWAILISWVAW